MSFYSHSDKTHFHKIREGFALREGGGGGLHLASFRKWEFLQLDNGLFLTRRINIYLMTIY